MNGHGVNHMNTMSQIKRTIGKPTNNISLTPPTAPGPVPRLDLVLTTLWEHHQKQWQQHM